MNNKEYVYFPGCSAKGTGKAYEESLLSVFKALGLAMKELDDWSCCGATLYMSVDEKISFALSCRNMALASKVGSKMVVPCSACYLVFKKTMDYVEKYGAIKTKIQGALHEVGLTYEGGVELKHPLEIILDEYGVKKLGSVVKNPLKNLRIAPYYGCQIVRPYTDFDDPVYPTKMDNVLEALGASVIDYPLKTRCCGGSLMGTIEEIGLRLNYILLKEAVDRGANCIAVLCPLCQFNLECYQEEINNRYHTNFSIPILYFTQVMGMAMGLGKEKLGLQRAMVPVAY
jgi:heterodisulfide reductase subunit B2